jgi:general secretion pathway protein D
VVADARTNSVIVSTSKERMDAIGDVIKGLDQPVERQGNLTVVALRRANAQDVATALNQALGARTTGATATTTTSRPGSMTTSTTFSGSSLGTGFGGSTPGRAEAAPAGGRQEPAAATVVDPGPTPVPAGGYQPQLANVLQLGGNATVVAEPNTNSLIITGTPESAALIRQLIEQLDEAPPQVLIEAIVAEVSLDAEHKLGFEWSWAEHPALGNNGLTGTLATSFGLAAEGATGLTYAIAGTSFSSLLHALATNDSVSILSTPRIFTSNNRQAVINISTATPYVNSVLTGEVTQTFSVQYLDVGVILQVTPQIAPDGTVTMQVVQQANELLGFRNLGNNLTAPMVATRSAQATIRVSDGQTVILGGIISNNVTRNEDKVPLLGDLPLVGGLFRHSTVSKTRSELLVFLTPKVVRTPEEAAALTASEQAKSIAPIPAASGGKGAP